MNDKYFKVENREIDVNQEYNTQDFNYGKNFDFLKYQHFLNAYARVMYQLDISVDFLVSLNNQIFLNGNDYLGQVRNCIVDEEFIDIYKLTNIPEHKDQRIPLGMVNYFIQSFDAQNQFVFFNNGTLLWEFFLEIVRNSDFSEKPRRLNSTFFFEDLESCNYYIDNHLDGNGKIYEIEIIKPEKLFEADMKIIDNVSNHVKFKDLVKQFQKYWHGELTESPIKEVVFSGRFKYKDCN